MILLIGGTSETAPIATGLARAGYEVLVSTATGTPLEIGDHPRILRRAGRLDEKGLVALGKEKGIRAIIDAAHPFAVAAHAAARGAAARLAIPCLIFRRPRLLLPRSADLPDAHATGVAAPDPAAEFPASPAEMASRVPADHGDFPEDLIRFAADHTEAAQMAFSGGRPVLLTTGSRNLTPYAVAACATGVPLAVRILDAPESRAACKAAGIPEERIIAGRGPFSVAQNILAIQRFAIGVIVSKESGRAGGIEAKLAAARQAGCRVIIIRQPETSSGLPAFEEPSTLITALRELLPCP